jgi:hypothetical protein
MYRTTVLLFPIIVAVFALAAFQADAQVIEKDGPELIVECLPINRLVCDLLVDPNGSTDFLVLAVDATRLAFWDAYVNEETGIWGIRAYFAAPPCHGYISRIDLLRFQPNASYLETVSIAHRFIGEHCLFVPELFNQGDQNEVLRPLRARPETDDATGSRRVETRLPFVPDDAVYGNSNRRGTRLFHPCNSGSATRRVCILD